MEYRCIECGFGIGTGKALYVQYSPGNIRLMKCENCEEVADEYIECETMILLIDLILHKPKAYRHLLYNVLNRQAVNLQGLFWKSTFAFLLLDACIHLIKMKFHLNIIIMHTIFELLTQCYVVALAFEDSVLLLNRSEEGWGSFKSFSSIVLRYGKMTMDLLFGNFMFLSVLLLVTRFFQDASIGVSRYKDVLIAIYISSYFKIFLVFMMVWQFPPSVLCIIDIFVLSSNTVALKVFTELSIGKCIVACFSAHAVKLFLRGVPCIFSRDH